MAVTGTREAEQAARAAVRVLIVEDNDVDYEAISAAISERFSQCETQRITTELEFIRAVDAIAAQPPHVIILDVVLRWALPERREQPPPIEGSHRAGVRIWKRLQENPRTRDIPTVVCTYLDIEAFTEQISESPPNLQIARRKLPNDVAELTVKAVSNAPQVMGEPRAAASVIEPPRAKRLFVSYAREDRQSMYSIRIVLGPLIHNKLLHFWDDTKIEHGEWEKQILEEMRTADAALFLVSAASLNSKFILGTEMEYCLKRHEKDGFPVYWILLKPALYQHTPLHRFQCLCGPDEGLEHLPIQQREIRLVEIAGKIADSLGIYNPD